jgi:hypothetical protein
MPFRSASEWMKRAQNTMRRRRLENIFFLHVPKCGGVSLDEALHSEYLTLDLRKDNQAIKLNSVASTEVVCMTEGTRYPFDTDDDFPILQTREKLLLYFMSLKRVRLITGHFTFSETAYRHFGSRFQFITMLRDPVQRFISTYFYRRYSRHELDSDLESYLQTHFARSQGYQIVKFIGGANCKGDYSSPEAIARAQENLHKFALVGSLNHKEDFFQKFECRFGVRLRMEHRNASPVSASHVKSAISDDMMETIRDMCRPDIELYQYAMEHFVHACQ